jgi:hypothetical protein
LNLNEQDNARRLGFARPRRYLLATAQADLWLHKKGFGRRSIVTQSLYLKRDLLMSRPFGKIHLKQSSGKDAFELKSNSGSALNLSKRNPLTVFPSIQGQRANLFFKYTCIKSTLTSSLGLQ